MTVCRVTKNFIIAVVIIFCCCAIGLVTQPKQAFAATSSQKAAAEAKLVSAVGRLDTGWIDLKSYDLSFSEFHSIRSYLERKHPEMFWLPDSFSCSYKLRLINGKKMVISASISGYSMTAAKAKQVKPIVDKEVAKGVAYAKKGKNVAERVFLAQDWVIRHVEYSAGRPGLYNAAVLHNANCVGFTAYTDSILRKLGIPTTVVRGSCISKGKRGNHRWLGVKVNGKWYHVDPTANKTEGRQDKRYTLINWNTLHKYSPSTIVNSGPACVGPNIPLKPTSVSGKHTSRNKSGTKLTIKWKAGSANTTDGYWVYLSTSKWMKNSKIVKINERKRTTATFAVSKKKTYYYKVKAYNKIGDIYLWS